MDFNTNRISLSDKLSDARRSYLQFIHSCQHADAAFGLSPLAEPSPYALCFAIFGFQLIRDEQSIRTNTALWDSALRFNIEKMRLFRRKYSDLRKDKPYLQLLAFTLSSLSIIGTLSSDPLRDLVLELVPYDIEAQLHEASVHKGAARSGNQAMFLGIILLHAIYHLRLDVHMSLDQWLAFHLRHLNRFGFLGSDSSMSHLQFQNGYHQYEIFEFLKIEQAPWTTAAEAVAGLADHQGHFAPYPGGGGCYDYDAVFLLTGHPRSVRTHSSLLERTARQLLLEQNQDGGFCESKRIRPLTPSVLLAMFSHIREATGQARLERLRYCLSLLRPKHNRIHTHWSRYSRRWNESNLWDSWFRMLTLARIDVAFDEQRSIDWGFINYPGIGFHHSFHG